MLVPFMNKICIACNKRPARIKFIKIVDGEWQDCMICQSCMMRFAQQQKGGILKLDDILRGLMEEGSDDDSTAISTPGGERVPATELSCSSCGLAYVSYRNTLILGCTDCYHSFADQLESDLKRIHGSTRHIGRGPASDARGGAIVPVEPSAPPAVIPPPEESAARVEPDSPADEILRLRQKLKDAVQGEHFEEAVEIRDRIRKAEERLKQASEEAE